ncbi:response regulator [Pseudomonas sp. NPDC089530]|uniref:hybrid sensor histidine kinase/response regulator n=1 Tax=Pseudomonas sp. NPDC089530 TaxID=3390651 RepID=UPI003D0947DF
MKQRDMLLENLTRSSIRLSKGLLVFLGLTLLLIGISYWSVHKMLKEQYSTFEFHFTRLMENIQEHEDFLRGTARYSIAGQLKADPRRTYQQTPLPEQGPNVYEGREFPFSIPFRLNADRLHPGPDELAKMLALGGHLTDYYSTFWSISHYQSPLVLLFNADDNFDISIPAAWHSRGTLDEKKVPAQTFVQHVFEKLQAEKTAHKDLERVHWNSFEAPSPVDAPLRLMAYMDVKLDPQQVLIQGAGQEVSIVSLLNMNQVNNIERIMDWSLYDHFTLVSPSGKLLIGSAQPDAALHDGLNIGTAGLVFKVSSDSAKGWTAFYSVTYRNYFESTLWPILALLVLLIGMLGGGWRISRWYRSRIVAPAYQSHRRLVESEAFSRAVIDSAPIGLCVVRRSDFKILLENQKVQQWPGSTQRLQGLFEQKMADTGETYLDIDGAHLQLGFVPTRYQGEDALLCAFNDVTRHIEGAAELEQARRYADAANEAKTLFLATMSHEIRTPLYGVLGTLELLGLTRLDARQREHLQTIQRSSSTLFQLISDVLDISKIESGQMAIESSSFCPLQMIEDTLHTYAAFAEQKGLLLYACIDTALPDLLLGDPMRIRQVLNNLISNAIKFTDSGRVVLRARLLGCENGQASLEWQVTDSGIGISPAQQERLFDAFYQVRDASSEAGAGLGLAICHWLADMMGGQIRVVSEPGLGSSFSFQLGLKVMPGVLAGCADILPTKHPVLVRAPAAELAQSTCDWLNRLGVAAKPLPNPVEPARQATLLVDILPSDTSPAWTGPRVIGLAGDHHLAPLPPGDCAVDGHDVRAIARAVSLTLHGKSTTRPGVEADGGKRLDLHILVAEDNAINQAIIKEQLEALGCRVTTAANGQEALQLWQPQLFDLVLTDVNMPLLNGYELTRALRERDRQIPIIGITANALREEGNRCMAIGMNAWIVKPLSLQTLHHYLSNLCAKAPAPDPEPMPPELPASTTGDTMIELSAKMRELFITTMRQDVQSVTDALQAQDAKKLAERLHSAAGALGAVQLATLAKNCAELESRILQDAITPSVTVEVESLIQSLTNILNALD